MKKNCLISLFVVMVLLLSACSPKTPSVNSQPQQTSAKEESSQSQQTSVKEESSEPQQTSAEESAAPSVNLPEGDKYVEMTSRMLFSGFQNEKYFAQDYEGVAQELHFQKFPDDPYSDEHSVEPIMLEIGTIGPNGITGMDWLTREEKEEYTDTFKELGAEAETLLSDYFKTLFLTVHYARTDGRDDDVIYSYGLEIDRNTLILKPVAGFTNHNLRLEYAPEDQWMRIPFALCGHYLYLDWNGYLAKLTNNTYLYDLKWKNEGSYNYNYGYASDIGHLIKNIGYFGLSSDAESGIYLDFVDGSYASNPQIQYTGENEATITWEKSTYSDNQDKIAGNSEGAISIRYYYTGCGADDGGLVIVYNDEIYFYQATEEYYNELLLGDVIASQAIANVKKENLEQLLGQQTMITTDLKDSFSMSGISVNIDDRSGKISMDNSFLFGFDEYELSAEGKEYLDKFMDVYASVISEKASQGIVAQILVEGHTDTSGTYEYNLTLSQKRAESVVNYCVSKHPELARYFQAKGSSFMFPVYKSNGSVDMDASRRVEFKFQLDI